jgi:Acetyltransferases
MFVRKCEISDVKEVYDLICELEDTSFIYANFEVAFNCKMKDKENYCILAVEENSIIGFLSLNINYQLHHAGKVATIEELVVTGKYRSKGAGKLLLGSAIECAENNGCDVIELTSNFTRERAHNFYIKNGFEKGSYKFKMKL